MAYKKDLPLAVLKRYMELKNKCEELYAANQDIINMEIGVEDFTIEFTDKDPRSSFFFDISDPVLDSRVAATNVHVEFSPKSNFILEKNDV